MQEKIQSLLGKLVVWALILVTLVITPLWALDPINPIKMLTVTAFGFMGLGVLLTNQKALELKRYQVPIILIGSFMGWQSIVLVTSGGEKLQQIFGTTGRNTGFITYLSFSILFVLSLTISNAVFFNRFLAALFIVGVASLGYGVIQAFDRDPFDWVNTYSQVFGFLGNPNFQSSLLGILGSIVFPQLFTSTFNLQKKVGFLLYLLLTVIVIKETDSQQGFLVLLIGTGFALGIFAYQKSKALGFLYFSFALVAFASAVYGILNKGPLASLLYKESVTYRGDYWRAGWKMTIENPIFGVGLDNYGDWYRRTRTIEATLRRGPDVTSNAAHNVFLDFSSYGGFPLALIYIALMALVIFSAVKVINRSHGFNSGFVSLISGWIAFQAQSIISINQIGLALWGWVLSGLIIGYEINTRHIDVIAEKKLGTNSAKSTVISAGSVSGIFVGLIIGVLVGLPPYLASAKYKSALETGNPTIIQKAAYFWPTESSRMIQVAMILNQNKLGDDGLQVALDAVARFPNSYGAWATLRTMEKASGAQKDEALKNMMRLDPHRRDF